MADQARWFKLWNTAPSDGKLQALPGALRWAWAAFGCYTKVHGSHGIVSVEPSNKVLAAEMDVPIHDLLKVIASLPNIYIGTHPVRFPHGHDKEPESDGPFMRGSYPLDGRGSDLLNKWCSCNGKLIVTWHNWSKYQEDTTVYDRVKKWRERKSVTVQEEKRREEKRTTPKSPQGTIPDGFQDFWSAYPRHTAKKAAIAAWVKLSPSADLKQTLLAAIDKQQATLTTWRTRDIERIPHPATWINGRRWEDELPPNGGGDRKYPQL